MKAFHSILKREEVYLKAYETLTQVQKKRQLIQDIVQST